MSEEAKTWEQFKTDAARLSEQILASNFKPSLIIALSRGGFIPARLLSNHLGVKRLTAIGITYTGPERTIPQVFSMPTPPGRDEDVLLVEDCLESGKSLAAAKEIVQRNVNTVRTCSIYKLLRTQVPVD